MSNEFFGATDTTNIRQAAIAALVQKQLVESARLAPTVTDYSMLANPGEKSVSVPRGLNLSATSKSEDTATLGSHFTYGVDTIDLAQKYVRVNIDDIARIQSKPDIQLDLVSRMGVALADDLDSVIYAQLKLASSTSPTHIVKYEDTSNNDIEVKDIVEAQKLLNIQKVPQSDRYMLINPLQMSYVMNIDTFVEAHRLGSDQAIKEGVLGKLFGFYVVLNNVSSSDNYTLFYHKSACGFAIQDGVKFEQERNLDHLANVLVASYIVGSKVLDSGKRVVRKEPT
jgi:N4-gp56 family major capsid protein